MEKTSFSIDEELLKEVNNRLSYGDNRSEWFRDAIRLKLAVLEEIDEGMSNEERQEFVVEAVREAVEN